MKFISAAVLPSFSSPSSSFPTWAGPLDRVLSAKDATAAPLFGFRDSAAQTALESRFLAAPDPKLAEEHLRILTQAPHMAGTPEDKATADYVAQKFREAGLETEIIEYRVWMELSGRNQRGPDRAGWRRHARPRPGAGERRSLPG